MNSPLAIGTIVCVIVVSLPVFNEEDGIKEFLVELNSCLSPWSPRFVVVNDCSTDRTWGILKELESEGFPVVPFSNDSNSGHGFSVLRGLREAVQLRPTHVILCDGDGQFHGHEVLDLYLAMRSSAAVTAEGVRTGRDDRWFRKAVSSTTRFLIKEATGISPKDANTPLRVIPIENVRAMSDLIPANCPVPNLAISALSRLGSSQVLEMNVRSRPPRRTQLHEDHWKQRISFLPSKRFIAFCRRASIEWLSVRESTKALASSGFRLSPNLPES